MSRSDSIQFSTINKFFRFDGICFVTTGKFISLLFKLAVNNDCVQYEIVLDLLSVESKTNVLYVNKNFTGNLVLGFGR